MNNPDLHLDCFAGSQCPPPVIARNEAIQTLYPFHPFNLFHPFHPFHLFTPFTFLTLFHPYPYRDYFVWFQFDGKILSVHGRLRCIVQRQFEDT